MKLPPSAAVPQTLWISLPGLPGRSLRVTLVTECQDGTGEVSEETTTAIDTGLALAALSQATRHVRFQP